MIDIPFIQILGAILTIGSRLTGIMLFAPFFGSTVISARIKAVLVLALTAMLYPMTSPKIQAIDISQWPLILASEFMIGLAVGVATNVIFDGIQMAGQILSIQMGYSLVNILDPQTQVESTVVATFHQMLAMLIFLRMNVHLWILRGLARSFDYLPPSTGRFRAAFLFGALHAGASVLSIGIQIAAPVLIATLFADIALGLLGKASPQLPLMLMGPAIKSALGVTILISTLKFWPDEFGQLFLRSIDMADHILHLAN